MGAHNFTETSKVTDPDVAYRQLVEQALHEYGSDGYNGTISTTHGFRVVSKIPMTAIAAEQYAYEHSERCEKWGQCEAVAVGVATQTKSKIVTFNVPIDDSAHGLRVDVAMIAGAASMPLGSVTGFEVLTSAPKFKTTVTPPGPARKVWVTNPSRGVEYATKAAALAAARSTAEQARVVSTSTAVPAVYVQPTVSATVSQQTVRTPEVTVASRLVSWKVKARLDFVVGDKLEFDHWLFYGMAAS